MSYKALYRTYRPNSFDEVAGQKHVVKTLENAVQQNKIAHAYLFCGPRGTGKTSIAKIFAKAINCENEEHKPCLVCDNCMAVQNGTHPDIIEIDAASNNGVDEVRTLIEKVKYAPLEGRYKVYIIDEVHMMSTGAFNALLKTIEEPPEHVIFILATTEPHKVLPTIISRCQRFDFTKVSKNEIVERIYTVLKAENISCDEEVVRIIAQLSDGGLRDALSILDQCIAYAKDNIKITHINEIYGITTVQEKLELFNSIFTKNVASLLNMTDNFIEKGIDIKRLTEDLIEILKETVIYEYTKDESLLHTITREESLKIITAKELKNRFTMINKLMESYDKYRFAANVGSYFEVCMLEMLDIGTETTIVQSATRQHTTTTSIKNETVKKPKQEEQNVSRETFNQNEEPDLTEEMIVEPFIEPIQTSNRSDHTKIDYIEQNRIKPIDNEFILSLLSGATKQEKASDMEKFNKINDYLMDLKWARFASLLRGATIVASGENYIVISVDSSAEANEINEVDSNNEFHDFIVELIGKNKKLFAISVNQQNIVIQDFVERMNNGTLPAPVHIEDVNIQRVEVKEPTQVETILDLFGEQNIIITED